MNKAIKFNQPYITGKELELINDVFARNQFSGNGYYTQSCQQKIKEILEVENVLLTDSCTSALEISALLLRKWQVKQQIILPSYTFSSTAAAFARCGFEIVFAEIEPHTMMIDIEDVKHKITPHTAAIVIVHYAGFCADSSKYRKLCDDNGLYLIEDAAQAFGSRKNDEPIGRDGDLSCYSFHETKNLHAGLAGALVVNNHSFFDRACHMWERGTNRQEVLKGLIDKYSWVEIGGSFYPTELQAAFLLAQLDHFLENLMQRKKLFMGYYNYFCSKNYSDVNFPQLQDDFQTNYHAFWLTFRSEAECDYVRKTLSKQSISAYIGYVPLHSSRVGLQMNYQPDDLPLTEAFAKKILRLPMHNNMSQEDVDSICMNINQALTQYRK